MFSGIIKIKNRAEIRDKEKKTLFVYRITIRLIKSIRQQITSTGSKKKKHYKLFSTDYPWVFIAHHSLGKSYDIRRIKQEPKI
jgi:hypothetical protein